MEYIYAALFSGGVVKFGRSVDVWHRMTAYEAEVRRQGGAIQMVMVSTVFDAVECERQLLDAARSRLLVVSRESFKYAFPKDVAEVFRLARFSFISMIPDTDKFGFKLTQESFKGSFINYEARSVNRVSNLEDKIDIRMLKKITAYSGNFTSAIASNKMPNETRDTITDSLTRLCEKGLIQKLPSTGSRDGFMYRLVE